MGAGCVAYRHDASSTPTDFVALWLDNCGDDVGDEFAGVGSG